LLKGMTWDEAVASALARAVPVAEGRTWGDLHRARLAHPLAPLFPEAAATLDPAGLPVGGDNDTVLANGCVPASGLAAAYGAIARYVYDVGNWDACRWTVFAGASGDPASPRYADQHPVWARTELVPMLYDWAAIEAGGDRLTLTPA
jgi:penicillin G amidase